MNTELRVNSTVDDAIRDILRQELQEFGLEAIDIVSSEDHDGDPVLRVDLHYTANGSTIDTSTLAGLGTKLRNRLWELGETRFPHLRHHVPEGRRFAD